MLTVSDFRTPTWQRLQQELSRQLEGLRKQNDGQHLDAIKTAAIRGQIAAVQRILSLSVEDSDRPEALPE